MQITVRTHHVSITQALKEYVEKKMSKLERFFSNIQEIQIELDVVGTSAENERQVARLEARKEHHSQVIERLNEQIGELQAALPAAEPDKELAATKE